MAKLMTSKEFIDKVKDIQKNYKTVYMLGTIGQPCTSGLIASCAKRLPAFYTAAKKSQLQAYVGNSDAFDCVGLIKAVLWGWKHGNAPYATNGVPDINETTMINSYCTGVSTNFKGIVPGEVVWLPGHIGVYVGDNLVIECTPAWTNNVQYTGLGNLGGKKGYNTRSWTKHGKLNWVDYSSSSSSSSGSTTPSTPSNSGSSNTSSKPSTPSTSKITLTVNGIWDSKMTKRLQQIFGTTADGVVSNQHAYYKSKNPGLTTGWEWHSKPNGDGSQLIFAIQKLVGAKQDGQIGNETISKMQKYFGTVVDGYISNPSSLVMAIQKWANAKN